MDFNKPDHRVALYLLLIIGLSLFIHLLFAPWTHLLVEEAYYWNYAQHLDFSYLDHPPMVALLIKLSTVLFGTSEFSVRLPSLFCYALTGYFSYRLTKQINKKAAPYTLLLLAVLPFFFLQFLVMTPDIPLIACWSASLFFLYKALVLKEARAWYVVGFWIGLGMLSKYTISLLGLATLIYLAVVPAARFWFKRKEPYLCALISALLFTPVIYWNATHEWVSFLFQSRRRFENTSSMDLSTLIALVFFFITPLGVVGMSTLFRKKHADFELESDVTLSFIKIYTLVPLVFFALFSLNHRINLNWIGPLFLALIPWFALLMASIPKTRTLWLRSALALLMAYMAAFMVIYFNHSEQVQQKVLLKAIAWESLVKQFYEIAKNMEEKTHKPIIFIPLDNYPIGSELAFYQAKFLARGQIVKAYPSIGADNFGIDSLMYRFWSKNKTLEGTTLILISKELWRFDLPEIARQLELQSGLEQVWSKGEGNGVRNIPYYYKIAQLKS